MFDRSELPTAVTVYEVGPRDGLQNESVVLSTVLKAELIKRLVGTGIPAIEVASFVRPDLVPALADGEEVSVGVSLVDRNELGAEAEADDGEVDFLFRHGRDVG